MRIHKASKRYALAFFELAEERHALAPVLNDIQQISKLTRELPELQRFFANPIISREKQKKILNELFSQHFYAQTMNFLHFLAQRRKLSLMPEIAETFCKLYTDKKGVLQVKLSSVVTLLPEQLRHLSESLKKVYAKDIEVESILDPNLLGGFKIQIEDFIYDFSVREQLRRYKQAVMTA